MRILAVSLLVAGLSTGLSAAVVTLSPGETLQMTFTSVPTTADLLVLFNYDSLTVTGSPVITTQLYNGSTLLASVVSPTFPAGGSQYYEAYFRSPSSIWNIGGAFMATADLSSMQNGTINGIIVVTVSGGAISGFDTTHFKLEDATSVSANEIDPLGDVTLGPVTLTAPPAPPAPVPTVSQFGLVLLAIGLIGAGALAGRRFPSPGHD